MMTGNPVRVHAASEWIAEPCESDASRVELLCLLGQRVSLGPRHLAPPAPSLEQLRCAAGIAARAPDHGRLQPFRFVRVDSRQRERLSQLFASVAQRRGCDDSEIVQASARAYNGPALIGLVALVRDGVEGVPVHEQWLSVGGGLMNFLNALHLMGFGAKTLSGPSIMDAFIQRSFCQTGERLVAWVLAGTPLAQHISLGKTAAAREPLSDWAG